MGPVADDSRGLLTVACSKGRLAGPVFDLLGSAGWHLEEAGRRLWLMATSGDIRFLEMKSIDVITCVERGVADLGIVGKDMLLERPSTVLEIMNLGVGECRLCLAGPEPQFRNKDREWQGNLTDIMCGRPVRIATRYPHLTGELCRKWDLDAVIIGLSGSVELAPAIGLSDIIFDVVASGRTLADNGLVEIADIMPVSARVVANPGSMHIQSKDIDSFCRRVRLAVEEAGTRVQNTKIG